MTYKRQQQFPPVIWVVVADRARSRILSSSWPTPNGWTEVADLVHAEGALKESEVKTDGQGMFREASAGHQHTGQPRTDFKHQTAERFAEEIVAFLEDGRSHNKFGKLGLVCAPLFLGVLRKNLSSPLAGMVTLEIDKDYTHAPLKELSSHLKDALVE
jgi:protein required for attachment to host cells